MSRVVIGLGSNIEPEKHIAAARAILRERYRVIAESRFLQTMPVGNIRQADFINGAVLLETSEKEDQLRRDLKAIETSLGRDHSQDRGGPRTIDLDIIAINGKIVDGDYYEREYLRSSVLELLPELKEGDQPC